MPVFQSKSHMDLQIYNTNIAIADQDQDQDFFYVLFYIPRNCGKVVDNKQIQEMQSGEMGVC